MANPTQNCEWYKYSKKTYPFPAITLFLHNSISSCLQNCASIFFSLRFRLRYAKCEYTVKKRLSFFPSPTGMSLTKLSWPGIFFNNSRPGRVWLVTSRLGLGKSFLQVGCILKTIPHFHTKTTLSPTQWRA